MAELAPRPDAPAVMRKLPDRRAATPSPALRLGTNAEVPSLGLRPEGGASVDRQLRPDGVGDREPDGVLDGAQAAGVGPRSTRSGSPARLAPGPARGGRPPPRPATRSSSPPPPSFTTSSSACRPSCWSSVPDGDLAAIVEHAVTEKLQRLEARRFARTPAPRKTLSQSQTSPTTRQIPAAVKRAVYERDGGRCRYAGRTGETVHGAPGARVPSPAPLRPRRRPLGCQHRSRVQVPQPAPGRGRLRPRNHRSASPLGDPSPGADAASLAVTSAGRESFGSRWPSQRRPRPGHVEEYPWTGRVGGAVKQYLQGLNEQQMPVPEPSPLAFTVEVP